MTVAGGFTSQSVVRRSSPPLSTELDGEAVLMGIDSGRYYGLDTVGGDVWQRLATPSSVGDICATLAEDYDGDAAQIEHDVEALLIQVRDEGLREVVS